MNELSSVSKEIFSTEEETQSSNVDSSSQYNKETEEEEVVIEENENENDYENEDENEKEPSLDDEPFYFESDTLALRNNPDYSCLMKTLILLEGQRVKATSDLEKLYDMKEAALKDPIRFVNSLKEGENSSSMLQDAPTRQKIYCLPEIDWNKYYECVDVNDLEDIKSQHKNRTQSLRQASKLIQRNESTGELPTTSGRASARQHKPTATTEETVNYNKSWSVDEQRKLEELLIEFPPEDNEAARWRKIATKLGTRTPLQVQSHCQKYFIKLAKAGLPIPGRMPNLKTYVTKKGTRGRARGGACMASIGGGRATVMYQDSARKTVGRGVNLNEMSSMWSSFNPPIVMNDENDMTDSNFDYD